MAKRQWSRRCSTRYTAPMPPSPSRSRTLYLLPTTNPLFFPLSKSRAWKSVRSPSRTNSLARGSGVACWSPVNLARYFATWVAGTKPLFLRLAKNESSAGDGGIGESSGQEDQSHVTRATARERGGILGIRGDYPRKHRTVSAAGEGKVRLCRKQVGSISRRGKNQP